MMTIVCTWRVPHTVMNVNIDRYEVEIGNEANDTTMADTNDLEYIYNVTAFGVHNISVVAVITQDLKGEKDNQTVNIPTSK